ncbi:PLC-like phosphodiesterase [Trichoderma longibrachiatum ATCC 18648]|uniref:PLC-like phosphodiesterase n=1 Tax=Trichoderma longibrachiatum ATCC 18648 TaxID=983965 RepID=A0A2T4C9N6_TRILO|nr:PLC-like phosphodiesterase [Trichoderma longibrachiatum ATCC 18648]
MTASAERQPLMRPYHRRITAPKPAKWASAIPSRRNPSRSLPQAIAHRGFKALLPENSMAAFRKAVEVGAHALETDVHLSKDGVVVLSHDPSLKRCFGVDLLIKDCTWSYLSSLRTLQEPHEALPRLVDLLEYLVSGPETENIWVLLDIKIDDNADDLLRAISCALTEVSSATPWDERIIVGCWNKTTQATFIKAALHHLPSYPLAHISTSLSYSNHFLPIPNLAFNMLQLILVGPLGTWFLKKAKAAGRPVFAWTVNQPKWMEWCIRRNMPSSSSSSSSSSPPPLSSSSSSSSTSSLSDKLALQSSSSSVLIDGVITDNPQLFLQVCSRIEDELDDDDDAQATSSNPNSKTAAIACRPKARSLGTFLGALRSGLGTTCGVILVNALATSFFWYRRLQGRLDKFDVSFFKNFQG